jgi:hypothetical protein
MSPRRPRNKALAPASALAQYGLAYGVGIPVFVLYRIGRRLRRRHVSSVNPRQP